MKRRARTVPPQFHPPPLPPTCLPPPPSQAATHLQRHEEGDVVQQVGACVPRLPVGQREERVEVVHARALSDVAAGRQGELRRGARVVVEEVRLVEDVARHVDIHVAQDKHLGGEREWGWRKGATGMEGDKEGRG